MEPGLARGALHSKNIVVTGAANGIGRQTALEAVARGASTVWVVDRDESGLTSLRREVGSAAHVRVTVLDLRARADIESLGEEWSTGPCPDILVNVAGIRASTAALMDITDEEWNAALDVNLTGSFLMTRAVARAMARRGVEGVIVNIASTAGVVGYSERAAYCASKAGVLGFTRSAALDLAPLGIRVFAVSPGFMRTGISDDIDDAVVASTVPLRRRGDPRELAALIFDLVGSSFVTGSNILVDGGAIAGPSQPPSGSRRCTVPCGACG